MKTRDIARVCHEALRAYSIVIFDYSNRPWEDTDEDSRQFLIDLVEVIIKNPSSSPRSVHGIWSSELLSKGWVYGPTPSKTKHKHPQLIGFDDLHDEDVKRYALLIGIVRSFDE